MGALTGLGILGGRATQGGARGLALPWAEGIAGFQPSERRMSPMLHAGTDSETRWCASGDHRAAISRPCPCGGRHWTAMQKRQVHARRLNGSTSRAGRGTRGIANNFGVHCRAACSWISLNWKSRIAGSPGLMWIVWRRVPALRCLASTSYSPGGSGGREKSPFASVTAKKG